MLANKAAKTTSVSKQVQLHFWALRSFQQESSTLHGGSGHTLKLQKIVRRGDIGTIQETQINTLVFVSLAAMLDGFEEELATVNGDMFQVSANLSLLSKSPFLRVQSWVSSEQKQIFQFDHINRTASVLFRVLKITDVLSRPHINRTAVYKRVNVSCPLKGVQWPDGQLCSHCPGGYSEARTGKSTQVEGGAENTPWRFR